MSHWQNVIKKILSYSGEHQILSDEESLIVGLSGGPDSVFLAHFLASQMTSVPVNLHLAHVNYGLRGEDSDDDETFCRDLAKRLGCPISVLNLGNEECREPASHNFQAWARKQRYDFFYRLSRQQPQAAIVVAHHLSDQVETFLLRMLRGSGPSGLTAMRPSSLYEGVPVLRPLLCLTRQEIVEALAEQGFDYRVDSSNESDRYRRNRLRHRIVPELQAIEPGFERLTGEALLLWQAEDTFLQNMAKEHLKELKLAATAASSNTLRVPRQDLKKLPLSLRLRVLREMIGELTGGPQSITFHHVKKIDALVCHGPERARYDLPEQVLFEQGPIVVSLSLSKNSEKLSR